ncbi:MAG: hypothetical protein RL199_820 [Pseudomonadota bacterium]|jgi:hypothetical protein
MRDWMPDVSDEEMATLEAATGEVAADGAEVEVSMKLIGALIRRRGPLFQVPSQRLWRPPGQPRRLVQGRPKPCRETPPRDRRQVVRRVYVDLVAARAGWLPGTPWGVA